MLERLDEVAWSDLKHAYGEASDVPFLIRELVSTDSERRDEALIELYGNIWHQGTIYEATVHALPFLIELLADPSTPDRENVAHLVASVISGNGYYLVHASSGIIPRDIDLDEVLEREREVVSAIRVGGEKAISFLIPYLSHANPEIRAAVAGALACLKARADELAPLLQVALESEGDEMVRESIIEGIESRGDGSSA